MVIRPGELQADKRFFREVEQGNCFARGEFMLVVENDSEFALHQRLYAELGPLFFVKNIQGHEANVNLVRGELRELIARADIVDHRVDRWVGGVEIPQRCGQQREGHRRDGADPEFAGFSLRGIESALGGGFDVRQDVSRVGREDVAGVGQRDAASGPGEEGKAELFFQVADLGAEGGLREVQLRGRAAEV